MGAAGDHRLIAARDLVLALGARLDTAQAVVDRPFDGLVIAELEVEKRHLLGAAPVTAIERLTANEVERSSDRHAAAAGEEQQDLVAHALANEVEELARQVRPAPLPRAGVLVEGPHRVPF